ncbi:MAG: DUF1552 domain-containing protein [Archangiaceae bacterium]|nr:DUF1552 domain-containing protein [Archangiaceae bacterium]
MNRTSMNRRMFLRGAGGALLAIPLLPSLLPREAQAQAAAIPKRYVAIWSNYDYGHSRHWYPQGGLPLTLNPAGEAAVKYQALRALIGSNPALSRVLGAGLTPHLGSLNLFRGLDFPDWFGHGFAHALGNLSSSQSNDEINKLPMVSTLDQVLGRNARINPHATEPFVLGNQTSMSYGPDASGKVSRKSPMATTAQGIYSTLFRGGQVPESGQMASVHPRRDVLSRVLDDYKRVRSGAQISSSDKVVLDNALDKLSEVQRNLAAQTTVANGCSYKGISTAYTRWSYDQPQALKNMADLLVAAMMCDVNRVFHFTGIIDDDYYNKSSGNFHDGHSHSPRTVIGGKLNHEYMADIQGQLVSNFIVPLLNGMAAATDAVNGKSMLYNSLVHFAIESGTAHSFSDSPTLLAGNAGGALTSGHLIDYTNPALDDGTFNLPAEAWEADPQSPNFVGYGHGVQLQRIFVNVLQAMGLARAEYERADLNTYYRGRSDSSLGAQNNGITDVGGYGHIGVANPIQQSQWMMYGHHRMKDYNYNFFKTPLLMPPTSAA